MDPDEDMSDAGKEEIEAKDDGQKKKKGPYPWHVVFIIGNEFCERFSFYGMKAILFIYFTTKFHWSRQDATDAIQYFVFLVYFTPVFGSIISDQLLGKYRTIIYLSLVYILGHAAKTIAPIPDFSDAAKIVTILGLLLIGIGSGGIKPCVASFGGDQFKLPEDEQRVTRFFGMFYFAINLGSAFSTLFTPMLRKDVQCFGEHTCYSLAFGVPGLLMAIATIIIICGQHFYIIKMPEGNVLLPVVTSIAFALWKKLTLLTSRKKEAAPVEHWMDHARARYDHQLVEDVKALLGVAFMYLPLPFFWMLFHQQDSTWTFQAANMDGELGFYTIKPDQMQLVNAVLVLIFIPIFNLGVYPLFGKCGLLKRPLQRMAVGGFLAALSFVASALLEMEVQKTHGILPSAGHSQINVMNGLGCPAVVSVKGPSFQLNEAAIETGYNRILYDLVGGSYTISVTPSNCTGKSNSTITFTFTLLPSEVRGIVITPDSKLVDLQSKEDPKRHSEGDDKYSFYVLKNASGSESYNFSLKLDDGHDPHEANTTKLANGVYYTGYVNVPPRSWDLSLNGWPLGKVRAHHGGVHSIVIFGDNNNIYSTFTLTNASSVHMLWQLPQYAVITAGEILVSITGLEFSYSQAPKSMKAVVQAFWLLTVAFGSVLIILFNKIDFGDSHMDKFMFLCAGLLAAVMILFSVMAYFYKYKDVNGKKDNPREFAPLARATHHD